MAVYAKEHNKDSVGNKKIISHSTVIFYKNRNAKMASAHKQNNKTFLFLNKYLIISKHSDNVPNVRFDCIKTYDD